jgi:hypothetical protein
MESVDESQASQGAAVFFLVRQESLAGDIRMKSWSITLHGASGIFERAPRRYCARQLQKRTEKQFPVIKTNSQFSTADARIKLKRLYPTL